RINGTTPRAEERPPSATTSSTASTATMSANNIVDVAPRAPNRAVPVTTAAEAPTPIPRMPGSPNGLRVIPWIRVPDTANPAPTIAPITVRGMRESTTLVRYASPLDDSAATTSETPLGRLPRNKLVRQVAARTNTSAARMMARRMTVLVLLRVFDSFINHGLIPF